MIKNINIASLMTCLILGVATNSLLAKEIHQHKSLDIGDMPIPKILLDVSRDEVDGVNVHVNIENYILNAPNSVDSEHKDYLQGHAHVFVNGVKRQRLYGQDIHIPTEWLVKGVNQIAISLNSHRHENWVYENKSIVGSAFINPDAEELVLHNYSSQPLTNLHANHNQHANH